eukprot:UN09060
MIEPNGYRPTVEAVNVYALKYNLKHSHEFAKISDEDINMLGGEEYYIRITSTEGCTKSVIYMEVKEPFSGIKKNLVGQNLVYVFKKDSRLKIVKTN